MQHSPLVSVIIPCYNLGEYVEDAIKSLQLQSYDNWECIVVDDGSTEEKTVIMLRKLEKKYSDVRFTRQKNQGLSQTRNNGIGKAKGSLIVCLDADDELAPTYLEECVSLFMSSSETRLGVVTTWLKEFGERDNIWKPTEYSIPKLLITNRLHAASMFSKEAWQKVGGYKKEMQGGYEDWEFWLSLVEADYIWAVIPKPLFYYQIRKGSMLAGSEKKHGELYARLISFHQGLYRKYALEFAEEVTREYKLTTVQLREKDDLLAGEIQQKNELEARVKSLTQSAYSAAQELADLKNTRSVQCALKVREQVGFLRHATTKTVGRMKQVPQASLHSTRVKIAPYVPPKTRKQAKKVYHTVRSKLQKPVKDILVVNTPWPHDLPLVSIVITYYNLADTIDETLNSLRAQTLQDFEVILVNDGSPDETSKQKFVSLDTAGLQATLIDQKNSGVAAARNNGLKVTRGKYLMSLDGDDKLDPTYLEKAVTFLECQPGYDLFSTDVQMFGVESDRYTHAEYDPLHLLKNNMVTTSAVYRREAWDATGGYTSNIGYEDWEYWVKLAELGFWGKRLPEPLFIYRTALRSRYVEDKLAHTANVRSLVALHPKYAKKIRKLASKKKAIRKVLAPETAFENISDPEKFLPAKNDKPNALLVLPWMTFGGAETLIYNFSSEVKDQYNISFITGLSSEHEWEWKFKEISPRIYHLANLFQKEDEYLGFISNYIAVHNIQAMHIIHTSFVFPMLAEIKKRHPNLKVIATMFNDRAEHFAASVANANYIDTFTSDNDLVARHYKELIPGRSKDIIRIPNGINCYDTYNPDLFDRAQERQKLGAKQDDINVFFVGRLSEEKNPDVFVDVARKIIKSGKAERTRFYVIGDGQMGPEIKKAISAEKSDRLQYLGYQAYVAPYLAAADIFILPSKVEGFPLSILEAMAMKVAVVSSRVGAVPDVIEDGKSGLIVTPGSAREIEEGIVRLATDKRLLASVKENGRAAVEGVYSNTLLGKNYRKMYKETLEK